MNIVLTATQFDDFVSMVTERICSEIAKKTDNATEDRLITFNDAAKQLSVSKVTLTEWRKKGIINAQKIGNRVYFKLSEILKAGSNAKRN